MLITPDAQNQNSNILGYSGEGSLKMSHLAREGYERSGQQFGFVSPSYHGEDNLSTLYSMRPSAEVTLKLAVVTVQTLLDLKPVLSDLDVYEDTEAKGMSPITI